MEEAIRNRGKTVKKKGKAAVKGKGKAPLMMELPTNATRDQMLMQKVSPCALFFLWLFVLARNLGFCKASGFAVFSAGKLCCQSLWGCCLFSPKRVLSKPLGLLSRNLVLVPGQSARGSFVVCCSPTHLCRAVPFLPFMVPTFQACKLWCLKFILRALTASARATFACRVIETKNEIVDLPAAEQLLEQSLFCTVLLSPHLQGTELLGFCSVGR